MIFRSEFSIGGWEDTRYFSSLLSGWESYASPTQTDHTTQTNTAVYDKQRTKCYSGKADWGVTSNRYALTSIFTDIDLEAAQANKKLLVGNTVSFPIITNLGRCQGSTDDGTCQLSSAFPTFRTNSPPSCRMLPVPRQCSLCSCRKRSRKSPQCSCERCCWA